MAGSGLRFPETHWTTVCQVSREDPEQVLAALECLCRKYWSPVYAFIRQRGHDPHEAEDLTQGFFAFLLKKEAIKRVQQEKGRFRSFLLASVKNFLINHWDRQSALKRGGHLEFITLECVNEAEFLSATPAENSTPDKAFERRWAAELLAQVIAQLKLEYCAEGKERLFSSLEPSLTGEPSAGYAELARMLHTTEAAVRVALHRMRRRFGEMLRREIAQTVVSPGEVDDEIRDLFAAISA